LLADLTVCERGSVARLRERCGRSKAAEQICGAGGHKV